jgi:CrcB protein
LATLVVNLTGSGLAGCLAGAMLPQGPVWSALLLAGFLGSYTTVSAVSLETVGLWQSGHRAPAVAYVLASTAGALALAAAGWWAFASPGGAQ